ncbi:LacI family transcriptional regulator [Inquilinus limosus]|uniref:LacI family DNA-binding transcriptional regulator n=1 Tax=Inquilinus limosus TaxID=171674 RepID=UPI003F13D168
MQKPTLMDVARVAGVSKGTASNVFNHPSLVRPVLRERVEAAARQIGYLGPDPMGRMLSAGKVNAIGVATAEPMDFFFEDPFARAIMAVVAREADARGSGIALISAASDRTLAWNIGSATVDGFILFCIEGGVRLVELTRKRRLPFVALELGVDDETIPAVGVDNVFGARLAAEHVVALGHRRVMVLSMPYGDRTGSGWSTRGDGERAEYSSTADRVMGYFDALAEVGLQPPMYQTRNDEPTVTAALEAAFEGEARPTALLCMSDKIALIAIDWLTARGLRVPADVSVIGFDDIPAASQARPPLTTVAQPIAEIGRLAVEAILKPDVQNRRQKLPVTLVVRASTGPASRG